jgi:phospholipid/cholesterol/gamma-HCH transport system substrate-binding protein
MSRAFRLGVFIVTSLLIFAAGVFWIGKKQFLFHSTYRLQADFQNVAGLDDGAEVRVGGIHEGTVRQIQLPARPSDKVHVVMDLADGTRNVIKKDSMATIRSEGLVGDKFVEISIGSEQSPKVNNGDTIQGEQPIQFSELLSKTNELLDTTKGAVQNMNDTTANLKSITGKIDQGQGTMGELINNKKIFQNVNAATAALQENMEALKHNFFLRGFFRRRGYESAADLKKNEISQLPDKSAARTFSFGAGRVFAKPDTARLTNGKPLNEVGDYLQGNQFGLAVVAAKTDLKGDTEKDRLLTEARAMVARDYLVKHFKLEDTRIKTIGLGKAESAPDGGSVEVLVYPEEVQTPLVRSSNNGSSSGQKTAQ